MQAAQCLQLHTYEKRLPCQSDAMSSKNNPEACVVVVNYTVACWRILLVG
jgi:hypothetical protein